MKRGYSVFGPAYARMFEQDLHHPDSVDHDILKRMVLLDEDSIDDLYADSMQTSKDVTDHPLYGFAQRFKAEDDVVSVARVLYFTKTLAERFDTPFEEMIFGGTEQEIIARGTDWCTDMSRVGAALLQCLHIPARIVVLVDGTRAYHGHQVVEAFVEGRHVMCDFLAGVFSIGESRPALKDLLGKPDVIRRIYRDAVADDARLDTLSRTFDLAAISTYDITGVHRYMTSRPNAYYLALMKLEQTGEWLMGETEEKP